MTIDIDVHQVRRENMRWIILLALYNSRPVRCSEHLLLSTLQGIYVDATRQELRRELGYVEGLEFAEITRQPDGAWWTELTAKGVDLMEYKSPRPPGIARPEKYWG